MTFRSRLFATVALPVLAASVAVTPAMADALLRPFEVAQDATEEKQLSEEELLILEEQRAAEEEAQQAEEQQAPAEEEQPAEETADQPVAEEPQAAEETAEQPIEEQPAAEDAESAAEEPQAAEEAEQAAEEAPAAVEEAAPEAAAPESESMAEESSGDEKPADEAGQAEAEQPPVDETQSAEEPAAAESDVSESEAPESEPAQAETSEGEPATDEASEPAMAEEEPQPVEGEPATAEEKAQPEEGTPEAAETEEAPASEPVPEIVEETTVEERQEIAEDPSKTDETVVLPVENGAAVLDSDKDADRAGGRESREERRRQREEQRAQEESEPVPDSDSAAQAEISDEVREEIPQRIEAAISEEGERAEEAPAFAVPETTNIINNTVVNNTVINNNETVTNEDNSVNIKVRERVGDRTVLSIGDRLVVRGDDRPRLRRDSEEVFYDNLARGRVRETIVRRGGVRIVTIYDRYGDVLQRSRIGRDGREHILIYAPENRERPRQSFVDVGYELPPMRLRIPVEDYIIDTSSDPDRDYYEFLSEPPVERVERVYTIDEVKHSARLRDKVRRIDLDTITFATGSAEVPLSQARTLRSVAEAMQRVLEEDPGETFLIEGHTDAVGSDQSNLVLSDQRSDSVATLLSEVYGIPPENLQTQGYGERFLKVRTPDAEQQNRRVTIRRVTTLIRPMAEAN